MVESWFAEARNDDDAAAGSSTRSTNTPCPGTLKMTKQFFGVCAGTVFLRPSWDKIVNTKDDVTVFIRNPTNDARPP